MMIIIKMILRTMTPNITIITIIMMTIKTVICIFNPR